MNTPSTSYNRARRSTAGINRRYDEQDYVLVSFPQLNKHSIVPAASVDVDPLDKQNGGIKTFGSRKNLRIISSGCKEVMKERASRYACSAGSEEVELFPDEHENDENQDDIDGEYSPPSMHETSKEIKKRVITSEKSKSQFEIISLNTNNPTTTTDNYTYSQNASSSKTNPFDDCHLNFDRVYPSKTGTKRSHVNNFDESSLSGSDGTDNEHDKSLCVAKKSNELHLLLKKPRRKRKKQNIEPVKNVDGPCCGCIDNDKAIKDLRERLARLEKLAPVVKKFRSKSTVVSLNQQSSSVYADEICKSIEKVTAVNPNEIKSTTTRPTMIMRELIKKAGHINDKAYLKEHENLFQEFIQMKCMVLDENMKVVWKEIQDSLGRQHIDEMNNYKKKIRPETSLITSQTTAPQLSQQPTVDDDDQGNKTTKTTEVTTITTSESP